VISAVFGLELSNSGDLDSAIGTVRDAGRPTPKPYDQELVTLTTREHIELMQRPSSSTCIREPWRASSLWNVGIRPRGSDSRSVKPS
jgi:hypothetical protein